MTTPVASPAPLTVQDLLRSVPDLDRGEVRGQERWRRFSTTAWSEGWKAAALALEMYETSDFRSLQNLWHDQAVQQGKASGPYQGNSRFRRWWSSPPASPVDVDEDPHSPSPVRETFDVWLVTDRGDREVHGLMVFDRWVPLVREVPEIPMDARCNPRFTVPTRVVGEACFWVRSDRRGQGLGSRMAQTLVAAYRPGIEAAYAQAPFMPFMVAHDRAFTLLEHAAPWPLVAQSTYNRGQRRDMLHHAIAQRDDWPAWAVPLNDVVPTPRTRPSRARARRPGG